MSAFSNWNGPDCGHGPSLPQVATLENLLTQINTIGTQLTALTNQFNTHKSDAAGMFPAERHASIEYAIQSLTSLIGTNGANPTGLYLLVKNAQATADAAATPGIVDGKIAAARGTGAVQYSTITAEITAAVGAEASARNTKDTALQDQIGAGFSVSSTIASAINTINTYLNTVKGQFDFTASSLVAIKNNLTALDLYIGKLWLSHYLDFDIMTRIDGKIYPDASSGAIAWMDLNNNIVPEYIKDINGQDIKNPAATKQVYTTDAVVILGMLSETYDKQYRPGQTSPTSKPGTNKYKPGRIFIKYENTWNFDAIVDAVATYNGAGDGTLLSNYTGAINALASKNTARQSPIKFGLYLGTANGKGHVYVGVVIREAQHVYLTDGGVLAGLTFHCAGENIIPAKSSFADFEYPSGALHAIAGATLTPDAPGSWVMSDLTVTTVRSDNYLDLAGHGVAVTNEQNGILNIGDRNNTHQLQLNSKDRPDIYEGGVDNAHYKMAYLEDLSQSVYWQRSVDVIVADVGTQATPGELLQCLVTTDGAGNVLTWDPAPAAPNVNVPGVYTSDRTTQRPTAILFQDGAVALVQNYSPQSEALCDGKLNASNVQDNTDYAFNLVTGLDKNFWQDYDDTVTPIVRGTTLVDLDNKQWEIEEIDNVKLTFQVKAITSDPGLPFKYTLPAYYTLSGGIWSLSNVIQIPGHNEGYVDSISYEWSGMRKLVNTVRPDDVHYAQTYVVWTAHQQNSVTMSYPNSDGSDDYHDAWSHTDMMLDGFRNLAQQDYIDDYLQELAEVQPDWAEEQETIENTRPESPNNGKQILNPAFIQHRPWTGVALADGGSFDQPSGFAARWVLDAGDYRNNAPTMSSGAPLIPANQAFRNTVMKQMYGLYAKQPEIANTPTTSIWQAFARTFRILKDTDDPTASDTELWLSDGFGDDASYNLLRFIPFNHMKAGTNVLQQIGLNTTSGAITTDLMIYANGTDFTQRFHSAQAYTPLSIISDGTFKNDAGDEYPWLAFTLKNPPDHHDVTYNSPALNAEKADRIAAVQDEATKREEADEDIQDQIDGRANPPVFSASATIADAIDDLKNADVTEKTEREAADENIQDQLDGSASTPVFSKTDNVASAINDVAGDIVNVKNLLGSGFTPSNTVTDQISALVTRATNLENTVNDGTIGNQAQYTILHPLNDAVMDATNGLAATNALANTNKDDLDKIRGLIGTGNNNIIPPPSGSIPAGQIAVLALNSAGNWEWVIMPHP